MLNRIWIARPMMDTLNVVCIKAGSEGEPEDPSMAANMCLTFAGQSKRRIKHLTLINYKMYKIDENENIKKLLRDLHSLELIYRGKITQNKFETMAFMRNLTNLRSLKIEGLITDADCIFGLIPENTLQKLEAKGGDAVNLVSLLNYQETLIELIVEGKNIKKILEYDVPHLKNIRKLIIKGKANLELVKAAARSEELDYLSIEINPNQDQDLSILNHLHSNTIGKIEIRVRSIGSVVYLQKRCNRCGNACFIIGRNHGYH